MADDAYSKMMKGNPFAKSAPPKPGGGAAPAKPPPEPNAPTQDPNANASGKGVPTYPPDHQPAMRVPKGGSMCANCKFAQMGANGVAMCSEPNYIKWNGGSREIPAPADEFSSDWWQPKAMADQDPNAAPPPGGAPPPGAPPGAGAPGAPKPPPQA